MDWNGNTSILEEMLRKTVTEQTGNDHNQVGGLTPDPVVGDANGSTEGDLELVTIEIFDFDTLIGARSVDKRCIELDLHGSGTGIRR